MQLPPTVPGYELIERLGGGPLTCVYSARDSATDELCAVKLLRPDWEDQPTAVKLLQGESLRRRLRRDDRLDVLTALWIVRQCAEALTVLHKAGFLHGDIKPDNIRLVE